MNSTSPLGQYAPVVASLAAIAIIGAFIASAFFGNNGATGTLHDAFLIAIGAIFGSAAAVPAINGHVAAQAKAANQRLDKINAPPANDGGTQ